MAVVESLDDELSLYVGMGLKKVTFVVATSRHGDRRSLLGRASDFLACNPVSTLTCARLIGMDRTGVARIVDRPFLRREATQLVTFRALYCLLIGSTYLYSVPWVAVEHHTVVYNPVPLFEGFGIPPTPYALHGPAFALLGACLALGAAAGGRRTRHLVRGALWIAWALFTWLWGTQLGTRKI